MAQGDSMAMTPPQAVARDWRTPLELLVLGAIWGSSFLFMRIAANPFGPFALVEVRLALGALVLLPFLWRERAHFRAGLWPKLAIIGAINSAIPFLLFAWAAQRSPAASEMRAVVAEKTSPEATESTASPTSRSQRSWETATSSRPAAVPTRPPSITRGSPERSTSRPTSQPWESAASAPM